MMFFCIDSNDMFIPVDSRMTTNMKCSVNLYIRIHQMKNLKSIPQKIFIHKNILWIFHLKHLIYSETSFCCGSYSKFSALRSIYCQWNASQSWKSHFFQRFSLRSKKAEILSNRDFRQINLSCFFSRQTTNLWLSRHLFV